MSLKLLQAMPATSEIEAALHRAGALLANSETARVLDRYRKARSALARRTVAATAASFGVAMAAAADEMSEAEAATAAREALGYLEALISK